VVAAQAPVWERLGRSRVEFRHRGPRRLAFGGHFSPTPDSKPNTALRIRCRFVSSCLVSPSASWPAGRHAATAIEDGADGGEFFAAGHDPQRAAAVAARAHVDVDQIAWSDLEQPKGWLEGRRAGCPE